jgi:hypothetical protein
MLNHPSSARALARLTLACALTTLAAACGGSSAGGARAGACATPPDSLVAIAVREYVQKASPTPFRFLVEATGDSALPDAGRAALQDKGPMYFFPAEPDKQPAALASLDEKGSYVTLLVLYGGTQSPAKGRAVVNLGGRYVGGGGGGDAPTRAYTFDCAKGRWALSPAEEPKTT